MLETIETSITDSLDVETSVNIYSSDDFDVDPQLLNNPQQALQSIVNSELNITLSNTFAQHFLDADSANYADNEAFQNLFSVLHRAQTKSCVQAGAMCFCIQAQTKAQIIIGIVMCSAS